MDLEFWKAVRRTPADAAEEIGIEIVSEVMRRRLPDEVVRAVRADARPYGKIADDFGLSYQTVQALKTRRMRAEVSGPVVQGPTRKGVLEPARVREIYRMPGRRIDIAARFGVPPSTVSAIKRRQMYAADTTPKALAADPGAVPVEAVRAAVRQLAADFHITVKEVVDIMSEGE